jgi:hypothetical protein
MSSAIEQFPTDMKQGIRSSAVSDHDFVSLSFPLSLELQSNNPFENRASTGQVTHAACFVKLSVAEWRSNFNNVFIGFSSRLHTYEVCFLIIGTPFRSPGAVVGCRHRSDIFSRLICGN